MILFGRKQQGKSARKGNLTDFRSFTLQLQLVYYFFPSRVHSILLSCLFLAIHDNPDRIFSIFMRIWLSGRQSISRIGIAKRLNHEASLFIWCNLHKVAGDSLFNFFDTWSAFLIIKMKKVQQSWDTLDGCWCLLELIVAAVLERILLLPRSGAWCRVKWVHMQYCHYILSIDDEGLDVV